MVNFFRNRLYIENNFLVILGSQCVQFLNEIVSITIFFIILLSFALCLIFAKSTSFMFSNFCYQDDH